MTHLSPDASWYQLALSRPVLIRSILCGVFVGSILCAVNHFDCIAGGKFGAMCLGKSLLTALIPFTVSMVSSVLAIKKSA